MKKYLMILLLASVGCASQNEALRSGSYIAYRIQKDKPVWVEQRGICYLDDATVRVYDDVRHGQKLSTAIQKECQ